MIEIIVSDSCPHCEAQLEVMRKSFFEDEYKVIKVGSADFEPRRSKVDAVPFVIVLDPEGEVKYANRGIHDGTALRKIERGATAPSLGILAHCSYVLQAAS